MKHCDHCGIEFEDSAAFCAECGHELKAAPAPVEVKENPATAPVTISTVLGLVSLGSANLYISLIMSIIGIVMGVKEKKATGKKLGLILNIVALVLTVLGILAIVAYLILYFFMLFTALAGGALSY